MEYHMEYSPNEVIKQEREVFVGKEKSGSKFKRKRSIFIVFTVSICFMFALMLFYFTRNENNKNLFSNSLSNNINDDYIINSLLKSESGKKFIVSKLEELISTYDKENKMKTSGEEENNMNMNGVEYNDNKSLSFVNKKNGNLKVNNNYQVSYSNIFDTKFLMDNLETVNLFYIFLKENNKKYETSEEMQKRFNIFSENYKKIELHNKKTNSLYKRGMNKFGDLSPEEFRSKYLNLKTHSPFKTLSSSMPYEVNYEDVINKYKPADAKLDRIAYDWRLHGGVTPVKDQALCGSCWAFSSVGSVESQYAIRKKGLFLFSEQELVDCSIKNNGCYGGYITNAFEDMIDLGGLCSQNDYPYVSNLPETCNLKQCNEKYTIKSYVSIPDDKFKEALRYLGPISISIAASDDFAFYRGGFYDGECGSAPNHAVILVGYGMKDIYNEDTGKMEKFYYYIIKNSWGADWGERGYINLETDINGYKKTCSIGTEAYVPLIE
ncbi:cysteine proteinase falcipain 3 [Plasmodium sp. DRC-Itaito]|nr:cysteine proteinase falcipain 3 [Plasmodium sp. DRC-Itaito]